MSKYTKQVIGFPTPLEMANSNPLDSRFVVTSLDDLTNTGSTSPWLIKDAYTNVYPGMQVYVTENNSTYMYVGGGDDNISQVADFNKWRLLSDADTQVSSLLTNVNVNAKESTVANHVASIVLNGDDVQLGSGYTGEKVSGYNGETISPTSADTINESFKKLVQIINDDEEVIAASANDLNKRMEYLSGKSVSQITSNGGSITISSAKTADGMITYDLAAHTGSSSEVENKLNAFSSVTVTNMNALSAKTISNITSNDNSVTISPSTASDGTKVYDLSANVGSDTRLDAFSAETVTKVNNLSAKTITDIASNDGSVTISSSAASDGTNAFDLSVTNAKDNRLDTFSAETKSVINTVSSATDSRINELSAKVISDIESSDNSIEVNTSTDNGTKKVKLSVKDVKDNRVETLSAKTVTNITSTDKSVDITNSTIDGTKTYNLSVKSGTDSRLDGFSADTVNKINALSAQTVTEIKSTDNTVSITSSVTSNGTVSYDLATHTGSGSEVESKLNAFSAATITEINTLSSSTKALSSKTITDIASNDGSVTISSSTASDGTKAFNLSVPKDSRVADLSGKSVINVTSNDRTVAITQSKSDGMKAFDLSVTSAKDNRLDSFSADTVTKFNTFSSATDSRITNLSGKTISEITGDSHISVASTEKTDGTKKYTLSLNDNRVDTLSAKTVTKIESTDKTASIIMTKADDGTVHYDIKVPKAGDSSLNCIFTNDDTHNVVFTTVKKDSTLTVLGDVAQIDCGSYDD